jgi:ribose-phosphate pyrophosphokinase
MDTKPPLLFGLNATQPFAERVASRLGLPLSAHEEREFEDGEHKARPLESVRGRDVYLIQSLYSDTQQSVNDKLVRLLFFIGALKDAAAERVTAVIPYLCYGRKDRKTKARDPVTTRYVAEILESVGVDQVVAMDVHNLPAYQNAFRCRTEHLEARPLFVEYFAATLSEEEIVVVSPDVGGAKRAERFRQSLIQRLGRPVANAFLEKTRSGGVVSGEAVVGDIQGKAAIIIDDLIASGTTIVRAVTACHEQGASRAYGVATHGLFVGDANRVLAMPLLEQLVVTDTIPSFRLTAREVKDKLLVLDATPLVAEAIARLHEGGSIVELLED